MTKLFAVSFLLLASPAFAVKPMPAHARKPAVVKKAAPAAKETILEETPNSALTELEKSLEASRVKSPEEFREDLKLSANGKDVELEKIPAAPEDTSTEN